MRWWTACGWWPRAGCQGSSPRSTTSGPTSSSSTRSRRSTTPTWARRPGRWAGPRRRPPARRGGEAPGLSAVVLVGHVTKDGGLAGPREAGARGRHGARLRGRSSPRPAAAAAVKHRFGPTQELACSRCVRRASPACPIPVACSSGTGGPGSAGPWSCRRWRGAVRCSSSCRRWSPCRPCRHLVGRPRGSTGAACRCWSPSCSSASRSRWPTTTSTRSPSAGSAWWSRLPTWRLFWRSPRRSPTGRSMPTSWRAARSAWAVSCARWPTRRAGWPKPPGSASPVLCCRCRPPSRPRAWRRSGRATVAEALAAVDLLRVLRRFERRGGDPGDRGHGSRFGPAAGEEREGRWLRPVSPGVTADDGDWPVDLDPDEASGG